MDTNITIPKKEIAPGVFTTGGNATIPTNSPASVITPDSLKQQPRINLEGTLAQTQTGNDVVSGAITNATGFDADYQRMLQLQAQPKAESDVMSKLLQDITGAEQGLTGRGATQLSTEEQFGINELTKRRAETTQPRLKTALAEFNALKTEFDQLKADLEVGTPGAGKSDIKLSMLLGQQGAVERQKLARLNAKASEIGLIEAEDLALKGQIDEAQKRADRAVDLLFADREAVYNTKLNQYNRIKDLLGEEDKKRGKALEYALAKEKEKIDEEKQNAKDIEKMIVEATPNAPASVIANARKIAEEGGSQTAIAQALGQYGGDYLKSVLLKEQIATEKAQRSKIYTDIAKTKSETTGVVGAKPTKPLSGEASKLLSISSGLETDVNNIKAKIDKVGYKNFLRGYLLGTDRETVKLLENSADKIGRLRSGGAINKDEEKRFLRQFASTGDFAFGNADIAKNALDSVSTEAQTVRSGIDPTGSYNQTTIPNKFNQSLGGNQTFPGTSIISNTDKSGNLIFNIPTQ